jgi:DNA-binding LytR/AlgR family response regulator
MEQKIVLFNSRDELLRIDISKIVYFEGDGNYTNIVTVNKLKGTVGMNLGKMVVFLTTQLGPEAAIFMRLGKRFIINTRYIYQVNVQKQCLILSDYDHFAFKIGVSKEALKKVKELMLKT